MSKNTPPGLPRRSPACGSLSVASRRNTARQDSAPVRSHTLNGHNDRIRDTESSATAVSPEPSNKPLYIFGDSGSEDIAGTNYQRPYINKSQPGFLNYNLQEAATTDTHPSKSRPGNDHLTKIANAGKVAGKARYNDNDSTLEPSALPQTPNSAPERSKRIHGGDVDERLEEPDIEPNKKRIRRDVSDTPVKNEYEAHSSSVNKARGAGGDVNFLPGIKAKARVERDFQLGRRIDSLRNRVGKPSKQNPSPKDEEDNHNLRTDSKTPKAILTTKGSEDRDNMFKSLSPKPSKAYHLTNEEGEKRTRRMSLTDRMDEVIFLDAGIERSIESDHGGSVNIGPEEGEDMSPAQIMASRREEDYTETLGDGLTFTDFASCNNPSDTGICVPYKRKRPVGERQEEGTIAEEDDMRANITPPAECRRHRWNGKDMGPISTARNPKDILPSRKNLNQKRRPASPEIITSAETGLSIDYRVIIPKTEAERQSIDEALALTKSAYFEWLGNLTPWTDRTTSYISQFNLLKQQFAFDWAAQSKSQPPNLFMLPAWGTSILDWPRPVKDDKYYEPYKCGHRAPRKAWSGKLIDVPGAILEELSKRDRNWMSMLEGIMLTEGYKPRGDYWEKTV
ncbi:hypothetical protein ACLMJK_009290 [Lecanora helva]